MTKQADVDINATATLRVKEVIDDTLIASIPGTDYKLHLAVAGPIGVDVGKRIRGEIHMQALRMHLSETGGNWIEPIYGMPRIVQGTVLHVDRGHRRVLFDMAVPVWVGLHEGQSIDEFEPGQMWNSYVESGARFEAC